MTGSTITLPGKVSDNKEYFSVTDRGCRIRFRGFREREGHMPAFVSMQLKPEHDAFGTIMEFTTLMDLGSLKEVHDRIGAVITYLESGE